MANTLATAAEVNESSNDAQLYALLHDVGWTPTLIVPAAVLSAVGVCGIVLNGIIVLTTIKNRKVLNRPANFLIALNAFFDMLQLCHPFPFLAVAASGTNFISAFLSFRLLIPSLFCIQCSLTCIALTGLDRLFSILFPIRYHNMGRKARYAYAGILTSVCVNNGLANVVGLWKKQLEDPDRPVTGFIIQIGWDSTHNFAQFLVGPVLIALTILSYLAIVLIMKFGNRTPPSEVQKHLLNSLAMIVTVHIATLLAGSLILFFSYLYSTMVYWRVGCLSIAVILSGPCSTAIVLYANSFEYRRLFDKEMGELRSAISGSGSNGGICTTIHPVGGPMVEQHRRTRTHQLSAEGNIH